jgi:hypothetical protein
MDGKSILPFILNKHSPKLSEATRSHLGKADIVVWGPALSYVLVVVALAFPPKTEPTVCLLCSHPSCCHA